MVQSCSVEEPEQVECGCGCGKPQSLSCGSDPADVAASPVDVLPLVGVAARINPGLQVGVAQKRCKIFH